MTPKDTLAQLNDLTTSLIRLSLCNEQYYPSTKGNPEDVFEITVGKASDMSVALKNVSYRDIYSELDMARSYNFKMLDGALVTLRYRFLNARIVEHSLSYFPSPDLEHFQNEPDVYLLDANYAEVVSRNIVPFPIRFDFSDDAARFIEIHHPYSHLTLGQYANCRIPVCSPVAPLTFGAFILRNFYNSVYRKYSDELPVAGPCFSKTITAAERNIPHLVLGTYDL